MILAGAAQQKDGAGSLDETGRLRRVIEQSRLRCEEIKLAPIRMGWRRPLPAGYVRGASAPIRAMIEARARFRAGALDCFIVSGDDPIRTSFAQNKKERDRLLVAYPSGDTFLSAYTRLAHVFMERHAMSRSEFRALSETLFDNYRRTFERNYPNARAPEARWFAPVSDVFRGVDCANPSVDFEGCVVLMTDAAADRCEIPSSHRVRVRGASVAIACEDDPANIPSVAGYDHVEHVVRHASDEAGLDFASAFLGSDCLLEVYSCYPVVPLGFLLHSGLAKQVGDIRGVLERHEVTITGGLNLAKAAGNNSTLGAIVSMVDLLRRGRAPYGAVHSNSAFGYEQAFAVLEAPGSSAPTAEPV